MHNSKYRSVGRLLSTRGLFGSCSILVIVSLLLQTGCQSLQPDVAARPDSMNSSLYRFTDDGDWAEAKSTDETNATTSQKPVATPAVQTGQEEVAAPSAVPFPRTIRGQSPQTGDGEGLTDAINRYTNQTAQSELPTFPKTTSEATLPSPGVSPSNPGAGASGNATPGLNSTYPPTSPTSPQGGGLGVLGQPGALDASAATPSYGYEAPGAAGLPYPAPNSDYQSTLAPGVMDVPQTSGQAIAPGVVPYVDPTTGIAAPPETGFRARERIAPVDVYVQEARTGRIILGGSVNSDLGVAGQLIVSENNFDIRRVPRSWDDIMSGRAFKGGGQNFRLELMPGNLVERYTVSWTERNLLGYLPYSLSVGGFYYTRQFRDWTEQRLGGRVALGYEVTKDLAVSTELRMEDVTIFDPRVAGVQELDSARGSNDLYTARFRISRDTRDNAFMATQGSLLELTFDQVFGEYDFQRGRVNYSRSFMMRERPDGTGRHILATTFRLGFSGAQTPIFENFFAGGYSSLRGFSFRGAGPVVGDVQVGGEFMALGSVEYVFPLTADDMLRGVAFVDYGTVEEGIEFNSENFRVSPGLGLRVTVPALGPAPLAFDFAYPINYADNDDRQVFSFFMGFTRQ